MEFSAKETLELVPLEFSAKETMEGSCEQMKQHLVALDDRIKDPPSQPFDESDRQDDGPDRLDAQLLRISSQAVQKVTDPAELGFRGGRQQLACRYALRRTAQEYATPGT